MSITADDINEAFDRWKACTSAAGQDGGSVTFANRREVERTLRGLIRGYKALNPDNTDHDYILEVIGRKKMFKSVDLGGVL